MSNQYKETYQYVSPYNPQPVAPVEKKPRVTFKFDRKKSMPIIILGVVGIILLIVIFIIIFGSRPATNNNGLDSSKNVVLQWWGVFLDPKVVQPLIDDYHAQHPNVKIEYANKWSDTSYTEAQTRYQTELNRVLKLNDQVQIPDIFMVNNTWAANYEAKSSPSTNISYDTFQNSFYPVVVDDFGNSNKVYGVPLWLDTYAILYNKDLLASQSISTPPSDWTAFRALAQKLTIKTAGKVKQGGFAAGLASNVSYGFELANILMLQNGTKFIDTTGKPSFGSDANSLTALSSYKDFAVGANSTWDASMKNDAAAFLEGNLAMLFAPSYRYRDILKYDNLYETNLNIAVSSIPQLEGTNKIDWADYWGNMVALNRPNREYAWDFLNWITQPAQLKTLSDNIKNNSGFFGSLYPRKDMSTELQADQYLKVFNDELQFSKSWDMVDGVQVRTLFNKVLDSGSTSQSTLVNLQTDVGTIITNKGKL